MKWLRLHGWRLLVSSVGAWLFACCRSAAAAPPTLNTPACRTLRHLLQATQACIDLEQQLRGRQGALEEARAAERQAHAAWEEKK